MRREIPQLARLKVAKRDELVAIWTARIGKAPLFKGSRELLAGALAWQLQVHWFGGLKPPAERRLRALARACEHRESTAALQRALTLRPGTAIVRQWRGQQLIVMALDDGFQYQGKVYRSLSHLAREITGTRWNGPAFFGLREGLGGETEVQGHGR